MPTNPVNTVNPLYPTSQPVQSTRQNVTGPHFGMIGLEHVTVSNRRMRLGGYLKIYRGRFRQFCHWHHHDQVLRFATAEFSLLLCAAIMARVSRHGRRNGCFPREVSLIDWSPASLLERRYIPSLRSRFISASWMNRIYLYASMIPFTAPLLRGE